jgi:hypothetical protein
MECHVLNMRYKNLVGPVYLIWPDYPLTIQTYSYYSIGDWYDQCCTIVVLWYLDKIRCEENWLCGMKIHTQWMKCLAKTMGGESAPQYDKTSTGWSKSLCAVYSNNPHTTYDLKTAITEYIRNVDRAILNTVFENRVRRISKCLETGRGHFENYL